ncbi:MAG: twin-arginine translocation signal domain-containing protein, partial [Acidobacteriota bacterium]
MSDASSSHSISQLAEVTVSSSRRNFLRNSAVAVAGIVTAGVAAETAHSLLSPQPVRAQSAMTPDAALKEIMDGNGRFVSGKTTAHEHDLVILKQHLEEKQEPYAAVLS